MAIISPKRQAQLLLNKQASRINNKLRSTADETVKSALEMTLENLNELRAELKKVDKNDIDAINNILLDYKGNAAYSADPKKAVEYMKNTLAFEETEIEVEDEDGDADVLEAPLWEASGIFSAWDELKGAYIGQSGDMESREEAMRILDQIADALKNSMGELTPEDISQLQAVQMEIEQRLASKGRMKGAKDTYKRSRRWWKRPQ